MDGLTSADVTSAAAGASGQAQAPAKLTATIAADRATVSSGQTVTATFTVTNGGATTANLTALTPRTTGTAGFTCNPSTFAPISLAAGGSAPFTWTCTTSAPGTLSFTGTVSGTDALSGGAVSATPATPATVDVQSKATLTASLAIQGSPATVQVGQALSVTLTVSDTGQASATVTSVQPTASPTNGASCTAATPAPPQSVTGTNPRTFTWTCTPTPLGVGTLTLGATVAGTDDNSGASVQATAPGLPVTVQAPVNPTATIAATPATVSSGQPVAVTFAITNGGTATANITAVTLSPSGLSPTPSCPAATPTSASIGPGATFDFRWTCTPATSGTLSLNATASGTVSGVPISPPLTAATPATVTVVTPASLSASLAVDKPLVNTSNPVVATLTVTNAGGASGSLTSVTLAMSSSTDTATCAPDPTNPAVPVNVPGAGKAVLKWTCTALAAGAYTVAATVGSTPALAAAAAPVLVTVQTPAALTLTPPFAVTPTGPVAAGSTVTLTLSLLNGGQATARVASVTPTSSPGGSNSSCTGATPLTPQDVAGSATATFEWTCTLLKPATTYQLGATVAATDLNTGAPLTVTVPNLDVVAN